VLKLLGLLVTFSLLKIKLLQLLLLEFRFMLGRIEEDFDWCEQTLFFGEDRKPLNMILDDGGDLTNMVLIATQILESKVYLKTTTGVHRLYSMKRTLHLPAI
jgi:adenosylhomocysteinase